LHSAGWTEVDGYIFPCLRSGCAPAANQVEATINRLHADGATIGVLWMDIERLNWPADHAQNQAFVRAMVQKAQVEKMVCADCYGDAFAGNECACRYLH
jgi:hypothetical protein